MKSQLETVANERQDVRVRFVDIGSWSSPVARQYNVRSLPTMWLYQDGVHVQDPDEMVAAMRPE